MRFLPNNTFLHLSGDSIFAAKLLCLVIIVVLLSMLWSYLHTFCEMSECHFV